MVRLRSISQLIISSRRRAGFRAKLAVATYLLSSILSYREPRNQFAASDVRPGLRGNVVSPPCEPPSPVHAGPADGKGRPAGQANPAHVLPCIDRNMMSRMLREVAAGVGEPEVRRRNDSARRALLLDISPANEDRHRQYSPWFGTASACSPRACSRQTRACRGRNPPTPRRRPSAPQRRRSRSIGRRPWIRPP